ncbi:hypothetical protein ACHQM5_026229 [Ranunculus cassubicifolius]
MKFVLSLSFIILLASQLLPTSSVQGHVLVPTLEDSDTMKSNIDLSYYLDGRKLAIHKKRYFGRGGGAVGRGLPTRRKSVAFQTPISYLSLYLAFGVFLLINLL